MTQSKLFFKNRRITRSERRNVGKHSLTMFSWFPLTRTLPSRIGFDNFESQHLENFISIKQSIIILTWFRYIAKTSRKTRAARIFIMKSKSSHLTTPKAPMAQKKQSKEQFCHVRRFFKISFDCVMGSGGLINSIDAGCLFLFLLKHKLPRPDTTFFFLKTYSMHFSLSDAPFFRLP